MWIIFPRYTPLRYQENWKELNKQAEQNASKAEVRGITLQVNVVCSMESNLPFNQNA